MIKLREAFLEALYPSGVACCICGRNARLDGHGLCHDCHGALAPCPWAAPPEHTDGAAAGVYYGEAAKAIVHRFKYEGCRYLGANLASFMEVPKEWRRAVLLPVPLHQSKERSRGYNQSLILARELAARYGMQVKPGLLSRVRDTGTQTHMAARERRENLKGAFKARGCRGLDILLVDDVLTTGSTASECALALKAAGAGRVYVIAACRTGREDEI